MDQMSSVVTPTRFAEGLTFDQYTECIGSPENLRRQSGWLLDPRRVDFSAMLWEHHERRRVRAAQVGRRITTPPVEGTVSGSPRNSAGELRRGQARD